MSRVPISVLRSSATPARRAVLGAVVLAGCGLVVGASPGLAAISGPVTLPGRVVSLTAMPDGSLRAATITEDRTSEPTVSTAWVRTIAADGSLVPSTTPTATGLMSDVPVVLTPDGGAIAAYATQPAAPDGPSAAVSWSSAADGSPGPEASLSAPGLAASYPAVAVGPTGAAAVTFSQGADQPNAPRLAYRAAGASAFAPSVPLDRAGRSDAYSVVLGPAGGGAVVAAPFGIAPGPVRVRRIAPEGTLGPWLTVPVGKVGGAGVVATFSGATLALVVTSTDDGKRIKPLIRSTSLPASGSRFTAAQALQTKIALDEDDGVFDLVPTAPGRVALLGKAVGGGLALYEGRPGSLRELQRIRVRGAALGRLQPHPGGGLTALWMSSVTTSTDVRLFSARRTAAAGRLGKPRLVPGFPADPGAGFFESGSKTLSAPAPLADGRTAIAYNPAGDLDHQPGGVVLIAP
ncbi:MAG: hypothetical protein AAGC46_11750 [Solirubrobacteraceae bacterium]|nr:hypothetical protein [Patulibacter sp.]